MERKIRIIGWLQFMWQMLYWENLIIKNSCLSRLILAKHDRYFDSPARVAAPYGSGDSMDYEPRRPHLRARRSPVRPSLTLTRGRQPGGCPPARTMQLCRCSAVACNSVPSWHWPGQRWHHRVRLSPAGPPSSSEPAVCLCFSLGLLTDLL